MQYNEVKIKVATADAETAAAIANMVVPYGLYIEDYSDLEEMAPKMAHVDLIEPELLQRDRENAVIHLYIAPGQNPSEAVSFVSERLQSGGITHTIECGTIDEEDWANEWKKYYVPVKIGERLVVVPSWEEYQPGADEVILTMDPGMAFGTGTHETTQLCTRLLEQYVDADSELLDVGTGSGILAIAAILLGAKSAYGVDIDEVAVRVANENARANNVQGRAQFVAGDLVSRVKGTYNLVTANIVADVILRLLPDLGRFLRAGGVFIASGIIETREQQVTQALLDAGFSIDKRIEDGGWVALSCRPAGDE